MSVGKHPGLIPGKVWVQVQESLERNKSKSFRKPRSNEALLTGLLFCSCGERMYPKMSKRKTADGKVIYTYVCKMKERSQRTVCNSKNANGNTLDMAIIEQVKMLADDKETFVSQLEQSRKFYTGNRMDYEQRISDMRKEKAETEKKINSLVDSLVEMGDSPAKAHVTKRIEQLNEEYQSLEKRIQELEGLTTQHALSDVEFDLMRQLLTVFKDGIDEMTIEQKRAAIRTIVRKVIWDGVNAHVVLFGVQDDEIEYPEIASAASDNTDDEDDNDELVAFSDVDYEDDDTEDDRLGKTNPLSASKTHWGRIANEILMMFRSGKKFSREVSIYDPIGADKDGETVSLLDVLEAGDREVLETVIIKQDVKILYEAYKENLTEMERTVIRMRYGLFGTKEHTQREIAEKLGISRSYVSRIEKRAVGHMREAFYEPAGKNL